MSGLNRQSECRAKTRVPVSMELRFSYRRGNVRHYGTGRTKDLTDEVVSFESDQEVPGGTDLELRISWPLRLQSVCPLELVIRGSLVRRDTSGVVLRMKSLEFQTHGEHSFDQTPGLGSICNILG